MPPSSRSPQTGEMTLKLLANRLVSAIPGNIRQTLALNPEGALTGLLGISVAPVRQLRDSRGAGGWCDGLSFTTDRIICYAPSPGSRRQNFTLMHEYGHLHISENDEALDWLADRQDPSGDLERLCDAVAAEILLPAPTITRALAGCAPAPGHLRRLYAVSHASEEVCAIALAARLPTRGAVALIHRRTATVAFAASSGWPLLSIPRGLAIPPRHPLRDPGTRQRWSGWTTPDLRLALTQTTASRDQPPLPQTPLLRAQAEAGPRRTTAILLDSVRSGQPADENSQAAEASHADTAHVGETITCLACGYPASRGHYPCEECGVPPCPACGHCRCPMP